MPSQPYHPAAVKKEIAAHSDYLLDIDSQLRAAFIFEVVDPPSPVVPIVAIAGGIGALILAVLAYLFLGRKIYGTWDIYSRGAGTEMDRNLTATASGSKASCRLDSLLDEMGM